jgi:Lrp/AsnC family transcriptional regulator, leucine-responsive regulatory protein
VSDDIWLLPSRGGCGRRVRYLLQVEETNRKIASLLARDGRMSFTELARQTGLSVSAAQQRVRRLEERGLISGYAALIRPDAAGLPLTAFISIRPFDAAAPDDAPERLAHLSAIEACYSVAGEENYILKVRVASPGALENLLQEIRTAASVSTRTTIVLSTPYENRPPDL